MPRNSSSAGLGQNSRASTSIHKNAFFIINMFAHDNCGFLGESMTTSKMHLLVLVIVAFWLVVNNPRLLTKDYPEPTTELLRNNGRFDLIEFNSRP